MSSHTVRVLAESKDSRPAIYDSITGAPLFWWRGSDLRIEIALSDYGEFITAENVGSIIVAVKRLTEGPDDAPAMLAAIGSADCDADFVGSQWSTRAGSLCVAEFTRAEAALVAGDYRLIVTHDDAAGNRNTYLSSKISIVEDSHDSLSLSSPPPPGAEYYTKTEADSVFRKQGASDVTAHLAVVNPHGISAALIGAASVSQVSSVETSLESLEAQVLAISSGQAPANYTSTTLAAAPSAANASGDIETLRVVGEVYPDEGKNGVYYRPDLSATWLKVEGDLTGRTVTLESGGPTKELLKADFEIEPYEVSLPGDHVPLVIDSADKMAVGVRKDNGHLFAQLSAESLSRIGMTGMDPANFEWRFDIEVPGVAFGLIDSQGKLLTLANEAGIISGAPEVIEADDYSISSEIVQIIFYGQSLSRGDSGAPVQSTAQPYDNLTFVDGTIATSAGLGSLVPLVENLNGSTWESPCAQAANIICDLIENEDGILYTDHGLQFLASSGGHGGQPIANLLPTDSRFDLVEDHMTAGHTLATAAGKSWSCRVFPWMQGESDTQSAETRATYAASYRVIANAIQEHADTLETTNGKILNLTYQLSFEAGLDSKIALAQWDLFAAGDAVIASPTYAWDYNSGGVHLTAVGYAQAGGYFGKAAKRILHDGEDWKPLHPVGITKLGRVVDVTFHVPVPPLVFDSSTIGAVTDSGFSMSDNSGAVALSSVAIRGTDTVRIIAARDIVGTPQVKYAIDYPSAGSFITDGAAGNLRDSDPLTTSDAGTPQALFNWALHFNLTPF